MKDINAEKKDLYNRYYYWQDFSLANRDIYYSSTGFKGFYVPLTYINESKKINPDITEQQIKEDFFQAVKEFLIVAFDNLTLEVLRYKTGIDGLENPMKSDLLWALYRQLDFVIGNGLYNSSSGQLSISAGDATLNAVKDNSGFPWEEAVWNIFKKYRLIKPHGLSQLQWSNRFGWIDFNGFDKEVIADKYYVDQSIKISENKMDNKIKDFQDKLDTETQERKEADNLLEQNKLDKKDQYFRQFQQLDNNGNPVGDIIDVGYVKKSIFQGLVPLQYDKNTETEIINAIKEVPVSGSPVSPIPIKDDNKSGISAGWAWTIDNENDGKIQDMQKNLKSLSDKIAGLELDISEISWNEVDTSDFKENDQSYTIKNYNYLTDWLKIEVQGNAFGIIKQATVFTNHFKDQILDAGTINNSGTLMKCDITISDSVMKILLNDVACPMQDLKIYKLKVPTKNLKNNYTEIKEEKNIYNPRNFELAMANFENATDIVELIYLKDHSDIYKNAMMNATEEEKQELLDLYSEKLKEFK